MLYLFSKYHALFVFEISCFTCFRNIMLYLFLVQGQKLKMSSAAIFDDSFRGLVTSELRGHDINP